MRCGFFAKIPIKRMGAPAAPPGMECSNGEGDDYRRGKCTGQARATRKWLTKS
jgi:hypothetical protein